MTSLRADAVLSVDAQKSFLSAAEGLADLKAGALDALNFTVDAACLGAPRPTGIFDRS